MMNFSSSPTQEAAAVSKLAAASCLSQLNSGRSSCLIPLKRHRLAEVMKYIYFVTVIKYIFLGICLYLSIYFSEENMLVSLCLKMFTRYKFC